MQKKSSTKIDISSIKKNLEENKDKAKKSLNEKHKIASKWLKSNNIELKDIRKKSRKLFAGASLAASLLLSPPPDSDILTPTEIRDKLIDHGYVGSKELENILEKKLSSLVPSQSGHADHEDEKKISKIIKEELGIKAYSQYEGQKLNHSIGWMGYEQHLKRFPGDTIHQHDENQQAGIAPGLGAWGYFTYSKSEMTNQDYLKEKYYFAIQTLYLPNWNSDLSHLVKWYKHRKMIAINPQNGKVVVGVAADAGPAKFTGKHFGGSPEVMHHLNLIYGKKKGKVILYFVDDPNDEIPLGPVRNNYQVAQIKEG
ncbi:hypothetical protein ACFL1M_00645 [Patescibacteria group bacterium]